MYIHKTCHHLCLWLNMSSPWKCFQTQSVFIYDQENIQYASIHCLSIDPKNTRPHSGWGRSYVPLFAVNLFYLYVENGADSNSNDMQEEEVYIGLLIS